ncbi:hypothetical protein CCYA_CCYA10G2774 [Cyanidiococcus yangmingshanensis]|nr:hypothetical protein CCYA_CCYA10G2774 [Cyanidiococcus yangmingshanensis]
MKRKLPGADCFALARLLTWKRLWMTCWILGVLWSHLLGVFATDVTQEPGLDGELIELPGNTFDRAVLQTLANHDVLLLQIYAPWCGHCRRFEHALRNISRQLIRTCWDRSKPGCARVGRLDGDKEVTISLRFGVGGFPSFYALRRNPQRPNRPDVFFYTGPHSEDALVSFVRKLAEREFGTEVPDARSIDGWRHPFGPVLRLSAAIFVAPQRAASMLFQLLSHWTIWGPGTLSLISGAIYWRRRWWRRRQRLVQVTSMNTHAKKPE